MKTNEVAFLEGLRLLGAGEEVARLDRVLHQQVLEPRMTDITHPIDVDQDASEIDLFIILYDDRGPLQHPVPVLYGRETVVDVSHIPMQVPHTPMAADVMIEGVEHFPLKIIIVRFNLIERDAALFGDLVDGERKRLARIKPTHRDRSDARRCTVWAVIEALAE
jgi:hypothetical protein